MSQKSLSPTRVASGGGAPSDLEARIAQLDARLRQARQENETARSTVSPSPRIPQRAPSQGVPATESSQSQSQQHPVPNPRPSGVVSTPSVASTTAALRQSSTGAGPTPLKPAATRQLSPPMPPKQYASSVTAQAAPPSSTATSGYVPRSSASRSPPRGSAYTGPTQGTPRGVVTSPWRAVAQRTNEAQDRETAVAAARHSSMANAIAGQIAEAHEELAAVNAAANRTNAVLASEQRQKNVAIAETTQQVQTAEDRLRELEKTHHVHQETVRELQSRKTSLQRQLEETKLGITSATARLTEIDKQQLVLDGRVKEAAAALREREKAITEENEQGALLRRRLESRHAALQEEVQQAADRLRRLEATQTTQEQKWKEEEAALQKQNDDSAALLAEMSTRRQLLEDQIADREEEAVRQRAARQNKAEAMVTARLAERERDLESSKREMDLQAQQLEQERHEALSELNAQLDALRRQTDAKRRAKEPQLELNNELEMKLASIKGELDQKELLQERCMAAEEQVAALQREHADNEREIAILNDDLHKKDQEVAELQQTSKRLSLRQEEERRLRSHVAELAREVTDTQSSIESEKALAEQRERERLSEIETLELELKVANDEVQQIRDAGAAEINDLSRRCVALRSEINEKEALLSNTVNEHAAKQAAIAQYEEEKRRLDREQLARKAAAAQAAKTALSELNF